MRSSACSIARATCRLFSTMRPSTCSPCLPPRHPSACRTPNSTPCCSAGPRNWRPSTPSPSAPPWNWISRSCSTASAPNFRSRFRSSMSPSSCATRTAISSCAPSKAPCPSRLQVGDVLPAGCPCTSPRADHSPYCGDPSQCPGGCFPSGREEVCLPLVSFGENIGLLVCASHPEPGVPRQ